jgi:hypothetical protein
MPADDDAARAEMARLLLEGARRLRREREAAAAEAAGPPPPPPTQPTPAFTEEELRKRPRYRPSRRPPAGSP